MAGENIFPHFLPWGVTADSCQPYLTDQRLEGGHTHSSPDSLSKKKRTFFSGVFGYSLLFAPVLRNRNYFLQFRFQLWFLFRLRI
jgi:hypothetical protein